MKRHFFLTLLCAAFINVNTKASLADEIAAGSYLSSRFAQAHHDWVNASSFLNDVVNPETADLELVVRSMIVAMGSGNIDKALEVSQILHDSDQSNSVVSIFQSIKAFKSKNYKSAEKILNSTPADPTIQFVGPFMNAWFKAAQGEVNLNGLQGNTIQLYHGILISDFLDDHSAVNKLITKALSVEDINHAEIERIADLYGHVGQQEKALELYAKILKENSKNEAIEKKIELLKTEKNKPLFQSIETVDQGLAQAFHDIANILANEHNDESARVFANLALYLEPDKTETMFLLGDINSRHEQFDAAVKYYEAVKKTDENYLKAQHKIVDIYEDTERFEKAHILLEKLSKSKADVDTIIKKGDLYRRQDNFKKAIKTYDKAFKELGGIVPAEYWHLHYVRGISYEQSDYWEQAEKDLQAALEFQPDHPYVLNYLGYAWADQGENLDQARDMIQRAVDLRPTDGYITDSLGWVLYRMRDYKGAVQWLEKAVELLPYDPTVNDHLGDAYWKVGRRLEARFQWERAKNYSDDDEQIQTISDKLVKGLNHSGVAAH